MNINQKRSLRMTLVKSFYDFTVQTDYFITAKRPDMIRADKEHHEFQIIGFPIPRMTQEQVMRKLRRLKNTWIWPIN